MLEQILEPGEPSTRGGQVSGQAIQGRSIDLQAGGLRPRRECDEVGLEGARLLEGGQVAVDGQQAGRRGQTKDEDSGREEHDPSTAADGGSMAAPATTGRVVPRLLRHAIWCLIRKQGRLRRGHRFRHDAGWVMTTKRGAVS